MQQKGGVDSGKKERENGERGGWVRVAAHPHPSTLQRKNAFGLKGCSFHNKRGGT
jgi:hypothetical protein